MHFWECGLTGMRILHTSDWHLGRQFHTVALDEDHDFILAQIEQIIGEYEPDLLIIAGDIFDRAVPPQSALTRFGNFIRKVTEGRDLAVVAIAGNHDSAAQIGMMGVLPSGGRSLVRGPIMRDEHPLIVPHADGDVAISALPFSYEFAARECFGTDEISCPADVLKAQVDSARQHVPEGARWVIVAHAFVAGASTSEGERPLSRAVGGIETIPASVFDGAHYVALGHLHRPQTAGADHIRYSGAPMAFGFDEEGDQKSVTIVDLAADGSISVELVPLTPKRGIRTVRGKLAELEEAPEVCVEFTSVILTDETPQIDPMKRVRVKYPNAVQLTYDRRRETVEERIRAGQSALDNPKEVVSNFLTFVRDEGLIEAEDAVVEEMLVQLRDDGESR
jgi:DNA repair protein SbcD/Mre11